MYIVKDNLLQNLITKLSAWAPIIPPLKDKGNDLHIHLELWKASVERNLFEKREICVSWQYKAVKKFLGGGNKRKIDVLLILFLFKRLNAHREAHTTRLILQTPRDSKLLGNPVWDKSTWRAPMCFWWLHISSSSGFFTYYDWKTETRLHDFSLHERCRKN